MVVSAYNWLWFEVEHAFSKAQIDVDLGSRLEVNLWGNLFRSGHASLTLTLETAEVITYLKIKLFNVIVVIVLVTDSC